MASSIAPSLMRWARRCSSSPTSQSTSCVSSTAAMKISIPMARSTPWRGFSPAIWIRAPLRGSRRSECRIGLADSAADASEAGLRRLIFAVDVERLGIGTGGLVLGADPFIGKPTAGPGPQVRRTELHRLIEILARRLVVADREIAQAARDKGLVLLAVERNRGREIVDGERVLALALIEQAAIVISFGIVRLQRNRFVEIAERLARFTLFAIDDAAAEITRRIRRVEC